MAKTILVVDDEPGIVTIVRDYLEKALRDYKSGQRKNAIMAAFAGALSTEDIANLAAWFNAQPAALSKFRLGPDGSLYELMSGPRGMRIVRYRIGGVG